MKPLNNRDYLQLWEQGSTAHPLDRCLLTLRAALPDTSPDALADWSLGRRNQALAELRCVSFGTRMRAWIACEGCEEKLEFDLDGREFLHRADGATTITMGTQIFRLPTSRDIAAVIHEPDPDRAVAQLVEACRVAGDPVTDLEEVSQQLSLADPVAEILIHMRCPACGRDNNPPLDIGSFLWTEIEVRARRLLHEIHELASAYGWTEQTIIALSDHRRAAYLEMVRA